MNIKTALFYQLLSLLTSFVARYLFIILLGKEYLGLNGLFLNLLSLLSLAEMGVGIAVTYSLYQPLSQKEHSKINIILSFYKKIYYRIGSAIFLVGLCLIPFLEFFMNEVPDIDHIQWIYVLFLINTSITYFFSYRHVILIADQKQYVVTKYYNVSEVLLKVFQISVLLLTKNYILFLVLRIVFTFIKDRMLNSYVRKHYGFTDNRTDGKLDDWTKEGIVKNIKGNIAHRIGYILVLNTDNLLMSKFVGIVSVGLYSNYYLILSSLNVFSGQIFKSIVASVGNLNVEADVDHKIRVYKNLDFFTKWLYGYLSICLLGLFNHFIKWWIGDDFLFSPTIVLLICINFYMMGIRNTNGTFISAMGLFWEGRYQPILESIINLVVSIILAQRIGVAGVLTGTFISTVTTCFWIEPYLVHKYGFNKKPYDYFIRFGGHTVLTVGVGGLVLYVLSFFPESGLGYFVVKGMIATLMINAIYILAYFRTESFRYYLGHVKRLSGYLRR